MLKNQPEKISNFKIKAYAKWLNAHDCQYNFKSLEGGKEAEDRECVFERS